MDDVEARLARLRGDSPARDHNARTIAALTSNPGCTRRAVLDAAGVDKPQLAAHAGFPVPARRSRFAIARGNAFESRVKADGCAELLRLLRERLGLPVPDVSYVDLGGMRAGGGGAAARQGAPAGDGVSRRARHGRTRALFARTAAGDGGGVLVDHPLLWLDVAGHPAYLEPDLVAFPAGGRFLVVEVKSFPIVDGQAAGDKAAAAAIQAAVYVLALRGLLAELGYRQELVASEAVLVCPENFSNRPTAALVDIRRQVTVLSRQLSRLSRVEALVDGLPPELTFDLDFDGAGRPRRPAADLAGALRRVPARYAPDCLDACELAYLCRDESRDRTAALGRSVRDELGGVDGIAEVLGFADGSRAPALDEADAAAMIRMAARLRAETLAGTA